MGLLSAKELFYAKDSFIKHVVVKGFVSGASFFNETFKFIVFYISFYSSKKYE